MGGGCFGFFGCFKKNPREKELLELQKEEKNSAILNSLQEQIDFQSNTLSELTFLIRQQENLLLEIKKNLEEMKELNSESLYGNVPVPKRPTTPCPTYLPEVIPKRPTTPCPKHSPGVSGQFVLNLDTIHEIRL